MGTSVVVRRARQADGKRFRAAREIPFPQLALAGVLAATSALRWRYLDIPLERDEGEFAYGGQLILNGEVPYASMYAMKLPGIYLAYALFEGFFGQTVRGIHFGLLIVNLASIVQVFAIARRLFDGATAALAALLFALVTFSASMTGTLAQAEHFVLLPALGGALLLLRAEERPRWWLYLTSGILLGLALLIKQHGGVYLLFGLAFAATSAPSGWRREPGKRSVDLLLLLAGSTIPLGVVGLIIALAGAWEPFVFWTFTYPSHYVREEPLANAWQNLRVAMSYQLERALPVWLAAAGGLAAVMMMPGLRSSRRFTLLWLAASMLATQAGFYFRSHYFLFLAPSLAMLAAAGLMAAARELKHRAAWGWPVAAALVLGVVGWSVYEELRVALPRSPVQLLRVYYPTVFADAPEIARIIDEHAGPDEPVAILGSEPQLLFYSRQRSATGHIYMYPLMERHRFALEMQHEAIRQIESADPQVLVVCEFHDSWGDTPHSNLHILYWCQSYVAKNYEQVARVELMGGLPAKFCTEPEQLARPAESQSLVYVMRRKSADRDARLQVRR